MQLLSRRSCGLLAAIWIGLVCGLTTSASAQQPAPAGAGGGAAGKPAQIGAVAVKSADAVTKLAAQIGVPLPPQASPQGLEQQFPFIGPGGLATDKPLGVVFFGGPGVDPQKGAAILLPVKPTAATMDALKAAGGQPLAGSNDTLKVGDGFIRRTTNYVVIGALSEVLGEAREDALADLLKGPDALARATADLKTIRTAMPEQYKAFLEQAGKSGAGPGPEQPGEKEGREWVITQMQRLDRLDLGLDHGDKGLRLFTSARPVPVPAVTRAERPGMPAGVLARVDLAASPSQLLHVDDAALEQLIDMGAKSGGKMTAKQRQDTKDVLVRIRTVLLDASAVSIGVELAGDAPVVYAVTRYAKPIDYTAEMRQLVGHAAAVDAESKEPPTLDMQTFEAAGAKVLRLRVLDKGKPAAFIDAVQRGDTVLFAGSDKQFLFLDRLLAAKPEGPMQGLAEGWIDLGKMFDSVAKQPNSPLAGMPPDQQKQIGEALKGQRLTLSATAEGDTTTFDLTIPAGLLQNVPKVIGAMSH
jgi:hypothetical protein